MLRIYHRQICDDELIFVVQSSWKKKSENLFTKLKLNLIKMSNFRKNKKFKLLMWNWFFKSTKFSENKKMNKKNVCQEYKRKTNIIKIFACEEIFLMILWKRTILTIFHVVDFET